MLRSATAVEPHIAERLLTSSRVQDTPTTSTANRRIWRTRPAAATQHLIVRAMQKRVLSVCAHILWAMVRVGDIRVSCVRACASVCDYLGSYATVCACVRLSSWMGATCNDATVFQWKALPGGQEWMATRCWSIDDTPHVRRLKSTAAGATTNPPIQNESMGESRRNCLLRNVKWQLAPWQLTSRESINSMYGVHNSN